jgi:hypothetical protein
MDTFKSVKWSLLRCCLGFFVLQRSRTSETTTIQLTLLRTRVGCSTSIFIIHKNGSFRFKRCVSGSRAPWDPPINSTAYVTYGWRVVSYRCPCWNKPSLLQRYHSQNCGCPVSMCFSCKLCTPTAKQLSECRNEGYILLSINMQPEC